MSAEPLHVQVAENLRHRIIEGSLAVGARLPTEAALALEFGSSRGTVRQALSALRAEGLIEGGQGRSPVVRTQPTAQPFETFLSFTAWAHLSHRTPGQQTIEVARRRASPDAASILGLAADALAVDLLRLRLLDDLPTMVERSTFVERVGRLLFDADTDAGSVYAYLIGHGVSIDRAEHVIDAVPADEVDADLLDVPVGTPLLRERRTVSDDQGRSIEYADDRYRPDRATFTISNHATNAALVRHVQFSGDQRP